MPLKLKFFFPSRFFAVLLAVGMVVAGIVFIAPAYACAAFYQFVPGDSETDAPDPFESGLFLHACPLSLSVNLTAVPNAGSAPLNNVDLTANVSGSATGDIRYRFDCTNDGTWEKNLSTTTNPYTARDLCDYATNGNYIAKVQVDRQGLTEVDTAAINVDPVSLSVILSADPPTGNVPLNNVDLTANVSGSATGDIRYRFDCKNDGSWEWDQTNNVDPYTKANLCNYTTVGNYTAKVRVDRQGRFAEDTASITVSSVPPTLSVALTANPNAGTAPLNNVDLTADVSGSATGDIRYRFDCTNDGVWERNVVTTTDPITIRDLCDYISVGNYTARVLADRQSISAGDTAPVTVSATPSPTPPVSPSPTPTLSVNLTAVPNAGTAPLNNVDLTADVSGSATGDIRYRFDCTNDGVLERTVVTTTDPYTALDLCDYATSGTYTASINVTRQGVDAGDTTSVTVSATPSPTPSVSPSPTPPPVIIIRLDAEPRTIPRGGSTDIVWTTTGATDCDGLCISPGDCAEWNGDKQINGSQSVNPSVDSTYRLNCIGPGGSDSKEVSVTVEVIKWKEILPRISYFLRQLFGFRQ
ncbi:MAG: hypothetical protein HYS57_01875 [Parcubacteria group bacterium]|nr:hypothetical protein [Parcubacteria group bacterium]